MKIDSNGNEVISYIYLGCLWYFCKYW
jgi:hypothetical protein